MSIASPQLSYEVRHLESYVDKALICHNLVNIQLIYTVDSISV